MQAFKSSYDQPSRPMCLHPGRKAAGTDSGPVRLLQLTDPHLYGDDGGNLLGITTRASFEAALRTALDRSQSIQALVLTGDLVHDESAAGYRYLRDTLKRTGLPHYCIAGNHDQQSLMSEYLGAAYLGPFGVRRLDFWNLIFLDSSIPGQQGGHLSGEQLDLLGDSLADDRAPTMVFLHHHPIPVGSAWMDTIGIDNGADLLDVCDAHPHVKGIVFGHVHQEFSARRGGYQILGTPSTCIQFMPGQPSFALDFAQPGYRELQLDPDGSFTTAVQRLDEYAEVPLHQADGY